MEFKDSVCVGGSGGKEGGGVAMVWEGGGGGIEGWVGFEEGGGHGEVLMGRLGIAVEGDECADDVMHDIYP